MKERCNSTILLTFIFLLSACSTLSPLQTYTSSSLKGVQAFESINYNFEHNCLATCRDHDLEAFSLTSLVCDCNNSKYVDSLNSSIYQAIHSYLLAMNNLAKQNTATLPIPALSKSIQASPVLNLEISQKEIDAYTAISNLVGNAMTAQYRKNMLKTFISEGQAPYTTLLGYLQLNLSGNLNGLIEVRMLRNKTIFYEYLRDKRNTPFQKREITMAYYKIYDDLTDIKQTYRYYTEVLDQLQIGHRELYTNLDNWNNDQLATSIANYASHIDALLLKIDALK